LAHAPLYLIPVGHLSEVDAERRGRSGAFKRLEAVESRYQKVRRASAVRLGEVGSTAPWQHTARELAAIHGDCLVAAEIAVIGAALAGVGTGGSITVGAPAFGASADYGMLVLETRAHKSSADWWASQVSLCEDDLSRVTWALAFISAADTSAVAGQLDLLDQVLAQVNEQTFKAAAQASSRLGATGLARRLPPSVWTTEVRLSARSWLLIAHHSASLSVLDPLPELSLDQLHGLAGYDAASWPAVRAVSARLLKSDGIAEDLLGLLRACGPDALVKVPVTSPPTSRLLVDALLETPDAYPLGWVVAAEHWQSVGNPEPSLGSVAIDRKWVPEL